MEKSKQFNLLSKSIESINDDIKILQLKRIIDSKNEEIYLLKRKQSKAEGEIVNLNKEINFLKEENSEMVQRNKFLLNELQFKASFQKINYDYGNTTFSQSPKRMEYTQSQDLYMKSINQGKRSDFGCYEINTNTNINTYEEVEGMKDKIEVINYFLNNIKRHIYQVKVNNNDDYYIKYIEYNKIDLEKELHDIENKIKEKFNDNFLLKGIVKNDQFSIDNRKIKSSSINKEDIESNCNLHIKDNYDLVNNHTNSNTYIPIYDDITNNKKFSFCNNSNINVIEEKNSKNLNKNEYNPIFKNTNQSNEDIQIRLNRVNSFLNYINNSKNHDNKIEKTLEIPKRNEENSKSPKINYYNCHSNSENDTNLIVNSNNNDFPTNFSKSYMENMKNSHELIKTRLNNTKNNDEYSHYSQYSPCEKKQNANENNKNNTSLSSQSTIIKTNLNQTQTQNQNELNLKSISKEIEKMKVNSNINIVSHNIEFSIKDNSLLSKINQKNEKSRNFNKDKIYNNNYNTCTNKLKIENRSKTKEKTEKYGNEKGKTKKINIENTFSNKEKGSFVNSNKIKNIDMKVKSSRVVLNNTTNKNMNLNKTTKKK